MSDEIKDVIAVFAMSFMIWTASGIYIYFS